MINSGQSITEKTETEKKGWFPFLEEQFHFVPAACRGLPRILKAECTRKTEKDEGRGTYNKFNNINGGKIRTESRDSEIEAASEELFGLFLALEREIWVDTSATVHSNSPTAHLSLCPAL